ncbi:GFA family protein [Azospirillum sp. HJ39]|uniref:GFA family protein n=1 Tax=Azospirillum sp. HJ39 TaxID=3159496 RepID=UPI0035584E70
MKLSGSCRCGAVRFTLNSPTPVPYMRCYCSICRKSAGGGGYAINLGGDADTLEVEGREAVATWRAPIDDPGHPGHTHPGPSHRHFCTHCGTALWAEDPAWPELVHPFASAIDTPLPTPPERVHIMLEFKAPWVEVPDGPNDVRFTGYPEESLEDWHRRHGLLDR